MANEQLFSYVIIFDKIVSSVFQTNTLSWILIAGIHADPPGHIILIPVQTSLYFYSFMKRPQWRSNTYTLYSLWFDRSGTRVYHLSHLLWSVSTGCPLHLISGFLFCGKFMLFLYTCSIQYNRHPIINALSNLSLFGFVLFYLIKNN